MSGPGGPGPGGGKLDINRAGVAELEGALSGIGRRRARGIVRKREVRAGAARCHGRARAWAGAAAGPGARGCAGSCPGGLRRGLSPVSRPCRRSGPSPGARAASGPGGGDPRASLGRRGPLCPRPEGLRVPRPGASRSGGALPLAGSPARLCGRRGLGQSRGAGGG